VRFGPNSQGASISSVPTNYSFIQDRFPPGGAMQNLLEMQPFILFFAVTYPPP
jgi:hypothetical protein